VFGRTHIKKYFFNNKEEIDNKMIKYFKDHLFMCVSKHYWFGLVTMKEYLLGKFIFISKHVVLAMKTR